MPTPGVICGGVGSALQAGIAIRKAISGRIVRKARATKPTPLWVDPTGVVLIFVPLLYAGSMLT